jgi:phenylacetate-CoA ligase
MTWDPTIELLPRRDLEALQGDRLVRLTAWVYERVPFYKQRLDEAGIGPGGVAGLKDLTRLPFTCKTDLRDHYPFGLFAVPLPEVVRLHASSGTTGKPTVVGYSREDLRIWTEVCVRSLVLSGAEPGQIFQNAYGYGLFTGGLGMHYGAEALGLTVVPVSGGNTARQILLMKDLGTQVVACTPSYALTLADSLPEHGLAPDSLRLKTLILGAEPWTEAMRQEIESRLHVDAVNIYGLSEVMGPGVANECVAAKDGSHICEDHFLVEVIDPQTGAALPDGETGELVFTTLTKQALPLLRYRTGDLASVTRAPCRCGRTLARMSRIVGRTDDMLIIRGVNVFPSQVEAALVGLEHLAPHHQLIVTRTKNLDELEVRVEVTNDFFHAVGADVFAGHAEVGADAVHRLEHVIQQRLREALGLSVKVTLTAPNNLPRSEGGKLNRVVDRRGLYN